MESLLLDLGVRQVGRLRNGHVVTIKPSMVGKGMEVKMDKMKAKKIMSAVRRQKGARLGLTEEECTASGLTWKAVKRGLKKVWDGYQKYAKPIVSPLAKSAIKLAAKEAPKLVSMAGAPELAPLATIMAPALEEAGLAIGKVTGAYSVKKPRKGMKKVGMKKMKGKGVRLTDGGAVLRQQTTCDKQLPATSPLVDVGNLQLGTDFIKGHGMTKRYARFNTALADPSLPASNPLVDVGNLQYGTDFIKGGLLYLKKGGLLYAST